MESKEILKKIVEEKGSCRWIAATPLPEDHICKRCPISHWLKDENGDYISCGRAVEMKKGVFDNDDAYLEVAAELLITIEVEDILLNDEDNHERERSPSGDRRS